jgi:UDP-GlcNAc:undecaprenyl-phosphate/decaprenyl-phosphate GlcNAc-1-phosphate transferase
MSLALAFAVAATVTLVCAPLAAAIARRTDFYDRPAGYKEHDRPTPYLGGVAVFVGFVAGMLTAPGAVEQFVPLVACSAGLLVVGTIDDRFAVSPRWRVLAEIVAATALSLTGGGWELFHSDLANLALTVLWVVGLVNAFNLMDNLDGAAATVAGVGSAGVGALALANGDSGLALVAFAVCGACAGFLPHNLAAPARIFLGDGGSMALGMLVAGSAIVAANPDQLGGSALLAGALLVGVPILDTTLVVVSRTRDRIPLSRGGRDHLTHRILARLGSARRVALALAGIQGVLAMLALTGEQLGPVPLMVLASLSTGAGLLGLLLLDSPGWKPSRVGPDSAPPG